MSDLVSQITKEIKTTAILAQSESKPFGFFRNDTGTQCLLNASIMEMPEQLFLSLIYENELTILMADTNVGKSIFAVQIADAIARAGRKVVYLDLEMSEIQFFLRYSNGSDDRYPFDPNFNRTRFDFNIPIPGDYTYDDYFIYSLLELVEGLGVKVVVIDNMTRLISGDTDSAGSAKPLMDKLNEIKLKYGLTLILLEHTRKTAGGNPISLNDLQGSKMKVNFADAVFTIGKSAKDKNIRYVKQLKVRSTEIEYDTDNVIVYEIAKDTNFLCFKFLSYSSEYEHIKSQTEDDKTDRKLQARNMYEKGVPMRAIGRELGVSEGSVRKWLKSDA